MHMHSQGLFEVVFERQRVQGAALLLADFIVSDVGLEGLTACETDSGSCEAPVFMCLP